MCYPRRRLMHISCNRWRPKRITRAQPVVPRVFYYIVTTLYYAYRVIGMILKKKKKTIR